MPFMLGSFTNGLFGGASDVFSLANSYMKLKEQLRLNHTGDNIENALKSGGGSNDATTNGLYGSSTAGAVDQGTRPDYETFDDDPELSKLPKIANKVASALKQSTSSPLEGKGTYGRSQAATADSPHDGKDAIGAAAAPGQAALSTQPDAAGTSAQAPTGGGLFDHLSKIGAALRDYSAQRMEDTHGVKDNPTPPPTYLPPPPQQPAAPMTVGPVSALPVGGVPYPNGPSLANQQSPLAALNPNAVRPVA